MYSPHRVNTAQGKYCFILHYIYATFKKELQEEGKKEANLQSDGEHQDSENNRSEGPISEHLENTLRCHMHLCPPRSRGTETTTMTTVQARTGRGRRDGATATRAARRALSTPAARYSNPVPCTTTDK